MVYALKVIEGGKREASDVVVAAPALVPVPAFDPETMAPPAKDLPYDPAHAYVERRASHIDRFRAAKEAFSLEQGMTHYRDIDAMLADTPKLSMAGLHEVERRYGRRPVFAETYLAVKSPKALTFEEVCHIRDLYPDQDVFIGSIAQPAAADVAHRPELREAIYGFSHIVRKVRPTLDASDADVPPLGMEAFLNFERKSVLANGDGTLGAVTGEILRNDTARFIRWVAATARYDRHGDDATQKHDMAVYGEFFDRMGVLCRHGLTLPDLGNMYADDKALAAMIEEDLARAPVHDAPAADYSHLFDVLEESASNGYGLKGTPSYNPSLWTGLTYPLQVQPTDWKPLGFAARHGLTDKVARVRQWIGTRLQQNAEAAEAQYAFPEASR